MNKKYNKNIKTEYGNASIDNEGYYRITNGKNTGKSLHRLVFEDYHDCTLDDNDVIHHIDNNPLNNHPSNLICMSRKAHLILHNKGKTYSDETMIKMSKSKNTSGYFRVSKLKCKKCKQGFTWAYWYMENGKHRVIQSTSIEKLEAKVKAKGLLWMKLE